MKIVDKLKCIFQVKIFSLVLLFLFSSISTVSAGSLFFPNRSIPQPRLIYPNTQNVDLKGSDVIEFEWSPHEGVRSGAVYYDFRVYKGVDTLAARLIYKTRVHKNKRTLVLNKDIFISGETYTWSLRIINKSRGKSLRTFQSFKIEF